MTPFIGPPTEVLILGSRHLGPDTSDAVLTRAVERLTAWKPDLVGIEILPGELVDLYDRQGGWLNDLEFGGFPLARRLGRAAQELTGWTRTEAARLAADGTATAPQRALAYVAAFEPWNALLHWKLDVDLPDTVAQGLSDLSQNPAESVRVGVGVARALGHQRLCLFDDFLTGQMSAEMWAEFEAGAGSEEFWAWVSSHPFVQREAASARSADFWDTLRFLNLPETVASNVDLETGANLRLGLPGRAKHADWEARNLFMAGRLRQDTMLCPGVRVLAIVGNSHKGPMEAALRALGADLRLVDFAELDGVVPA